MDKSNNDLLYNLHASSWIIFFLLALLGNRLSNPRELFSKIPFVLALSCLASAAASLELVSASEKPWK